MKARVFGVACLLLMGAGCKDDDDGGSSRRQVDDFTFENTVSAEEFDGKLDELLELRQSGAALTSTTANSNQLARTFMGVTTTSSECGDMAAIFGMDGSMPGQAEFRLQEGDSCANAVDNIKAFYTQALESMNVQVQQLKDIKPGSETCGMRVTAVDVDASQAAVAYKFTPYEEVDGLLYEHTTLGAATETTVSLGTSIDILMFGNQGDESAPAVMPRPQSGRRASMVGLNNYQMSGHLETKGDLEARSLAFKTDFKMSMSLDNGMGGLINMTSNLSGNAAITGLDDKLQLEETSRYEMSLDQGDGSDRERVALDMSFRMDELDDGTLKLTGNIKGHEQHGPMDFEVYMRNTGYGCQISMDYDPATDNNEVPVDPIVVPPDTDQDYLIQKSDILGEWESDWHAVYPRERQASLQFDTDTFVLRHHIMSNTTNPENENYRIVFKGSYALTQTDEYNFSYNDENFVGIDMTTTSVTITPLSANMVTSFNSAEKCGHADWSLEVAKAVSLEDCDLVEIARPYRTLGLEPNGDILRISETSYYSGATQGTRATLDSGDAGIRFLKQ